MKRIIAVLMVTLLIFSLAACGGKTNNDTDKTDTTVETVENVAPIDLLNTVWASYSTADEAYFPAAGGDMLTEETTNWEGPAVFGTTGEAAEAIEYMLHFPAASISKIDAAASLMHSMNANTFTCGAFHVTNTADVDALTTEIKTTIDGTQWMCGFPEKVLIVTVGDTIVAAVGNTQLVDTFNAKLAAAYTSAEVVVDEAIVA